MSKARCPPMGDAAATGARETLKELTSAIDSHLGSGLLGLYLFGSLAAGGFYPGKSDLDLMAIVAAEVEEGQQLESLRSLHDVTEKGKQTLDTLVRCGRDRLDELAVGWQPDQHPELRELIEGLARQFIDTTPVALPTRTS